MTVGREEGEEVPSGPQAPSAGGTETGSEGSAHAVAPSEDAAASKSPLTDQECIDSFPTAKLNKLDELISNPRYVP